MERDGLGGLDRYVDRIVCLDEVSSTNDVAKGLVREGFSGSALVVAEVQTAGRGRLGRRWSSPAGTGIWMSHLMSDRIELSGDRLPLVTLIAGLAVAEAVNDMLGEMRCGIKWPNDVIIGGKKLCGILTELVTEKDRNRIISGIGINVNSTSFPEGLSDKATSILLSTGRILSREGLAIDCIRRFDSYVKRFIEAGDLSPLLGNYEALLVSKNREVVLTSANGDYSGEIFIARGITKEGALIVEDDKECLSEVTSGEVSVRGILGYV